jgi:hypothetical protein
VRFNVPDGICAHSGHVEGTRNHSRLTAGTGGRIASFCGTIVVDGTALDDGENIIAISKRFP